MSVLPSTSEEVVRLFWTIRFHSESSVAWAVEASHEVATQRKY